MKKQIKLFFAILLLLSNSTFAKSSEITSWTEIIPHKGYVLSIDLHKNQECSKIWSKQIKEFLKMNPHVKNANLILVNKKIKVQSCKIEIKQSSLKEIKEINPIPSPEIPQWFAEIFIGASRLSALIDDTSKNGVSGGLKIGRMQKLKNDKILSLGVGLLMNQSKTSNSNDPLGVYEIKTYLISLESSLLFPISNSIKVGPKAMIVAGKDVSFAETDKYQRIGAYLGVESLFQLNKKLHLDINLQQRVDNLSRTNMLLNLGFRLVF